MACGKYTFTINQGETFYRRLRYLDSDNQPIDLTGYHGRMQIRPSIGSSTIICTLSSSIGVDGTGLNFTPFSASVVLPLSSGSIGITISAYSSSQFSFTEAVGDLFIYSGSGVTEYRDKILDLRFRLNRRSTE